MNYIDTQILRRVLDVLPVRDVVDKRADEVVVLDEVREVNVAFGILLVGFLCERVDGLGWVGGRGDGRGGGERWGCGWQGEQMRHIGAG